MTSIIDKIRDEELLGRSGSLFPVWKKWEIVKNAEGSNKYVICNASEGEIETYKDHYILTHHAKDVVNGVSVAMNEIGAKEGYIYINKDYYDELMDKLQHEIGDKPINIVKKEKGYIGGEETSIIATIEKKRIEPKIKPPFPATKGLWDCPTLINNVESFYCVSRIADGSYQGERFYSVQGDAPNKGVFVLHKDATVKEVLDYSGNTPSFDFFMQIGGGAGGKIILPSEVSEKFNCLGSLLIYNREKTNIADLMKKWAIFFLYNNCDKCTPCREGLYRINEMISTNDFSAADDIFEVMECTSLCPLGKVAVNPFKSTLLKLIKIKNENNN